MRVLVGNKDNIYTAAFNAGAKTLSISNVIGFDLTIKSLLSVYDTTVSLPFVVQSPLTTFAWAYVAGRPVFTWTFGSVPAGSANGDTLQIYLDIPQNQSVYSISQVISTATV